MGRGKVTVRVRKTGWGGARKKCDPKSQTGRVLDELYFLFGGLVACAELVGKEEGTLKYWRTLGYVPLKCVAQISKVLELNPYLICYEPLCELELCTVPTWDAVLKEAAFVQDALDWIKEAEPPKAVR